MSETTNSCERSGKVWKEIHFKDDFTWVNRHETYSFAKLDLYKKLYFCTEYIYIHGLT